MSNDARPPRRRLAYWFARAATVALAFVGWVPHAVAATPASDISARIDRVRSAIEQQSPTVPDLEMFLVHYEPGQWGNWRNWNNWNNWRNWQNWGNA